MWRDDPRTALLGKETGLGKAKTCTRLPRGYCLGTLTWLHTAAVSGTLFRLSYASSPQKRNVGSGVGGQVLGIA